MNTNLVGQDMALNAMQAPASYIEDQLKIWFRRRNLIFDGLQEIGLDLWKPEGAFYVLPRIAKPRETVEKLFLDYKVITYLGEWFGVNDRIRISYALSENEIHEGLDRIRRCLVEMGTLP
jgi:aspartate/methionine/tyrosine aminotransferase